MKFLLGNKYYHLFGTETSKNSNPVRLNQRNPTTRGNIEIEHKKEDLPKSSGSSQMSWTGQARGCCRWMAIASLCSCRAMVGVLMLVGGLVFLPIIVRLTPV